MANIDDVIRITVEGAYFAQKALNVYYYGVRDDALDLSDLATAFDTQVQTTVMLALSQSYGFVKITLQNLMDEDDFFVDTFSTRFGSRTGDPAPSFVAWGIRLFVDKLMQRTGAKRLVGVSETDISNGVPTGTALSLVNSAATLMGYPLAPSGFLWTALPMVATFVKPNPTDPPILSNVTPIVSGLFRWVTSQNSRKIGLGV